MFSIFAYKSSGRFIIFISREKNNEPDTWLNISKDACFHTCEKIYTCKTSTITSKSYFSTKCNCRTAL